jgi:hypothetical protein
VQNVERRPIDQHTIYPPLPLTNDPLPSVGTILPISGGSTLEFECKRDRKNYFHEVRNIIEESKEPGGHTFQSLFSEEDVKL